MLIRLKFLSNCLFIFVCVSTWAQDAELTTRTVSLQVLDKNGRPAKKVAVQSIDETKKYVTDLTGMFLFPDMTDKDTIRLKLPKYGKAVIPVAGMNNIAVTVHSGLLYSYADQTGQRVTVNKQNKTEPNPGTVLDVEALMKEYNFRSLIDILQSRVPGLNMALPGEPGQGISVSVRGEYSFLGHAEPLVVLDGIPMTAGLTEVSRMLNLYDVKTIEVQKTSSDWGVRGANGVILIKTK